MIGSLVPNFWSNTLLSVLVFGMLAALALAFPDIVRDFDITDATAVTYAVKSRISVVGFFILPTLVLWLPLAWCLAWVCAPIAKYPWRIGFLSSVLAGCCSMWLIFALFRGLMSPLAITEAPGLIELAGIAGLLALSCFMVWTLRRDDE